MSNPVVKINSMGRLKKNVRIIKTPNKILLFGLIFTLGAIIFSLCYTWQPLISFNQNTYFAHGMAKAGIGNLKHDWLTSTRDAAPVFSFLVYFTFRFLNSSFFYIYFFILGGVYIYSLIGISDHIFKLKESKGKLWLFVAIMVLVHSTLAGRLILNNSGESLRSLLSDGVAGQFILGHYLQPSTFGVFLLLSILFFLKGKPFWAVFSAGLAATFHGPSVLIAGILDGVYLYFFWKDGKNIKKVLLLMGLAAITVLPIFVYDYLVFAATSTELQKKSQEILVNRIPYHVLAKIWLTRLAYLKLFMVILSLFLVKKSRLFYFILVPTVIAVVLTVYQIYTNNLSLGLIFPWRISIFLVPLATSLIIGFFVTKGWEELENFSARVDVISIFLSISVIAFVLISGIKEINRSFSSKYTDSAENTTARYIKQHQKGDDVYVIPPDINLMDFRLKSTASILVDLKSHPYKDTDVIDWNDRMTALYNLYGVSRVNCQVLSDLTLNYKVNRLVLTTPQDVDCKNWYNSYEEDNIRIFTLKEESR